MTLNFQKRHCKWMEERRFERNYQVNGTKSTLKTWSESNGIEKDVSQIDQITVRDNNGKHKISVSEINLKNTSNIQIIVTLSSNDHKIYTTEITKTSPDSILAQFDEQNKIKTTVVAMQYHPIFDNLVLVLRRTSPFSRNSHTKQTYNRYYLVQLQFKADYTGEKIVQTILNSYYFLHGKSSITFTSDMHLICINKTLNTITLIKYAQMRQSYIEYNMRYCIPEKYKKLIDPNYTIVYKSTNNLHQIRVLLILNPGKIKWIPKEIIRIIWMYYNYHQLLICLHPDDLYVDIPYKWSNIL